MGKKNLAKAGKTGVGFPILVETGLLSPVNS